MDKIQLKIKDTWCVLGDDTSISIEMTNPLFNDSGDFSYPFTIPYKANKHLFNAAEVPESDVNLATFKERFELYIEGYGVLYGNAVCTSDEITEEDDSIELELRASTGSFNDEIEDLELRDIDYSDCIIGHRWEYHFSGFVNDTPDIDGYKDFDAHKDSIRVSININTDKIYPQAYYCNTPIIVNMKKKNAKDTDDGVPTVLSAHRICSSPNLYVLYVLRRIFQHVGYVYNEENVFKTLGLEDFKRLIIINTNCDYEYLDPTIVEDQEDYDFENQGVYRYGYYTKDGNITCGSDNLPDGISVSDFIDSLKNAFGLRVIFEDNNKTTRFILLRDVFRSTEQPTHLIHGNIETRTKKHNSFEGIKVAYNETDGDEFDYDAYTEMAVYDGYDKILKAFNDEEDKDEDALLRIDLVTGNFYRVKVDSSTNEDAQLFEVAQFLPYEVEGFGVDVTDPEDSTISFSPIIPTAINGFRTLVDFTQPKEAYFVDEDLDYAAIDLGTGDVIRYNSDYESTLEDLLEHDNGFTVGVLRTTPDGSLSEGYTDVKENADGFGNTEWVRTISTTTVTADSVTHTGEVYDYNGTDEGTGVALNEYISLKLWAGKQNLDTSNLTHGENGVVVKGEDVYNNNPTGILPNRGLVYQFLYEYLHFMKNRKEVEYVLELSPSVIAQIQWDKWYEIDGKRCLINSISYDADKNGVGMATMSVYFI